MSYPLPKDPHVAAYIKHLRARNVRMASRCYNCNKPTVGIDCDGYVIKFVCEDHITPDNPSVVHRVYVNGLEVPEHMMDPNLGGWKKVKEE